MMEYKYNGKHFIGEIVFHRGHKCMITDVWSDEGKNGITIKPINYGFEIDIYEEQL